MVLFTDLDSGPNTGGENNQGAWVTIYGQNFGATQGSVTVGGGAVAAVKYWGPTKIAVQLGAAAKTGSVVVNVGGVSSNTSVSFTVRAGNIRCVSTTGSDSGDGLWPNCWRTVSNAVHSAAFLPGDIVYVRAGVVTQGTDPYSAAGGDNGVALSIRRSSPQQPGALGRPLALVAYPGDTVTIGAVADRKAIQVKNYSDENATYWTIANFNLQGMSAMGISGGSAGNTGWRVIGNDMYCPNFISATGQGGSDDGCFEGDLSHGMVFYGNRVHDVGVNTSPDKFGHAVYWSTDSNHIDAGWNEVGPSNACRGIQFHSSPGTGPGYQQYDLSVHDNYIHDIRCDGINFATVDPSKGRVEAYNNLLVRAGTGGYAAIYLAQILNAGSACANNCGVKIYNNTMYASGSSSEAAISINSGPVQGIAQNNIFYQVSGVPAVLAGSGTLSCATNLFYGASAPSVCTGSITADPRFTAIPTDFTLQSNSPAVGTGVPSVCPATNLAGNTRTSCSLGAF